MKKIFLSIIIIVGMLSTMPLWASPININQATAAQLAENLEGVGLKKAQAIVQYREKIGEFHNKEQLLNVKGIGASTLKKNEGNILLQ